MTSRFDQLDDNARECVAASLQWMERHWDAATDLLWGTETAAPHHSVRGSLWYAYGLLMRGGADDAARAIRVIDRVLQCQFDAPGRAFHGTFVRAPEEPYPPKDAVIWRDYDPNWREFVVTALALVLLEHADRLPPTLRGAMDAAIRRAVEGARARGLRASYTNIALMHAFMLCFAGQRFGEPTWFAEGEGMARQVYVLFKQHDAFAEYNSPTYYGVDLYALALWRSYPELSASLASIGQEMEASLWRDVAQFYHAGLRNLAGPYDRSYGMDMRRYASLIGIWMRLATDKTHAPFPNTDAPFEHAHDLAFAPLLASLGARVPADALAHLSAFRGERHVERVIAHAPRRVATAWLGKDRMLGGEFTSGTPPESGQFHPATLHWRIDAERIGWVRLLYSSPVDARAGRDRLEIAATGKLAFLIHAPGAAAEQLRGDCWQLPGITVNVSADADSVDVQRRGDLVAVQYTVAENQPIHCTLQCQEEHL